MSCTVFRVIVISSAGMATVIEIPVGDELDGGGVGGERRKKGRGGRRK
jgi:hypothetical protein